MLNVMTDTRGHSSTFDNLIDNIQKGENNFILGGSDLQDVISLLNQNTKYTNGRNAYVKKPSQGRDTSPHHSLQISSLSPLSITLIEINNFSAILSLFNNKTIQQTNKIITDSLLRSLDDPSKSLVNYENGLYVILSQKTSLSSITRTTDSFLKSIKGLTIPYPSKNVYSVLSVNIGIGYFFELADNQSLANLFTIAGVALKQSRMTGGVVINTGIASTPQDSM